MLGERAGRERAEQCARPARCAASSVTASPPASSSAWLRATGTMPSAVDVEGHQRDVIGRIARPLDRGRLVVAREDVVDRHDAVGQVVAEAAEEADGEGLHRDVHREVAMHRIADALAADQRARRDARQRGGGIGVAPEQRQRRRDQAGAQHGEQRDHALDRVGKLDRHDGVGRQAEARAAAPRAPRSRGRPAHRSAGAPRPSVKSARSAGSISASASGRRASARAEQVVERRLHGGLIASSAPSPQDPPGSRRPRHPASAAARHQVSGR